MTDKTALVHTEDNYMLIVDGMTQPQIIEKLKEDGYSMGRTSLGNLMGGKATVSCGFTVVTGVEEATAPAIKEITLTAELFPKKTGEQALAEALALPTPILSRRQREGGYAGRYASNRREGQPITMRNWRVGPNADWMTLKEFSVERKAFGIPVAYGRNDTEGRGRRKPKSFYLAKEV